MDLDKVLHQPVRTRIVAFITTHGEATFTDLKKALHITDGNLEAHMKKLIQTGYVEMSKETGEGRPQTMYALTKTGLDAFQQYVESLQVLLNIEKYPK